VFGELHPARARGLGLRDAPTVFSLDLDVLYARAGSHRPRFQPPPRFPSVEVHLNVLAPRRLLAQQLLARIEAPDLVRRAVRDVWVGAGVPADQRRLTLELEFNGGDRSLTHEEVGERLQVVQRILAADASLQVELPR
jgi:phenylalanyl-tRNA synthetase beta chain